MSGGAFQYAYRRVELFAEELGEELDRNTTLNKYGEMYAFSPSTVAALREIQSQAIRLAKLMREAEWLYSGDTGEDTFADRVAKIEAGE